MDLSANEKLVLKAIGDIEMTAKEAAGVSGLKVEAATHAAYLLEEKGLATVKDEVRSEYVLTDEGRKYAIEGLPERIIYKALPEQGETLGRLKSRFPPSTISIAMGWLRQKGWAKFEKRDGETVLLPQPAEKSPDEVALSILYEGRPQEDFPEKTIKDLMKRNLIAVKEEKDKIILITAAGAELKEKGIRVEEEAGQLTPEMLASGAWQGKAFRRFDVSAPVLIEYGGRKHILRMALDKVKRTLIEMGFKEMEGPMVDAEFYVNDLLFMPQDHPARTQWDQFNLKKPRYIRKLPRDLVHRVRD
ncbi:MAG TPA: phenylalanine--tRNA ligase subunit alpha, partial [Methanocella sp.]|nr:phenylalanine--tRNA ligase subunit alpha [Methanocella sp.]